MADLDMDRIIDEVLRHKAYSISDGAAATVVAEVGRQLAEKLDTVGALDSDDGVSVGLWHAADLVREWTGAPTNEGERR